MIKVDFHACFFFLLSECAFILDVVQEKQEEKHKQVLTGVEDFNRKSLTHQDTNEKIYMPTKTGTSSSFVRWWYKFRKLRYTFFFVLFSFFRRCQRKTYWTNSNLSKR